MMIPKNLDNSGTTLLYIVGPDFVRRPFVGPTLAGFGAVLDLGLRCHDSEPGAHDLLDFRKLPR
jgi:hypothetical protein